MPPKKAARPAQENISLGPQVRDGELVFGGKFGPLRLGLPIAPKPEADTFNDSRKNLRILQRHLRPCHRSFVRIPLKSSNEMSLYKS